MANQQITGSGSFRFTITIRDDAPDDVFTRGQDPEWADFLYGPMTKDQVIEHWLHNAAANGIEDMTRLDGWADCPGGSITVTVDDVDLDLYHERP